MTVLQHIESVAVIGAGISGVVSAKQLKLAGIKVVVYERTGTVGGIWCYDERPSLEPRYPSTSPSAAEEYLETSEGSSGTVQSVKELLHAPPGPCYDGLTNNVSTPLLEIRNHPWKAGTEDFVNHRLIQEYIQSVADDIELASFTYFHTRVLRVHKSDGKWHVLSRTLERSAAGNVQYREQIHVYDAVVVASGHYQAPKVPNIPGLQKWKNLWPDRIQHSKSYRRPVGFEQQNVLLVGAGVSSMDIAREIGPFTNRVYQVYRPGPFELPAAWIPKNAQRIGNIKSFEAPLDVCDTDIGLQRDEPIPKSVILEDGSELRDIHRVILCTGYHFCLPFLPSLHNDCLSVEDADERCLVTDGTQVHNLHKDIFYIPDPTLAFIGIPFYSATFTMFEFQAITLAAMYTGRTKFPRTENMRKEYRDKIERKGYGRLFHSVRDREVEYVDELLAWINQDCAANGVPPIQGYTAKWRSERTVAREKIAKWFLSRSTAKASHVIDAI